MISRLNKIKKFLSKFITPKSLLWNLLVDIYYFFKLIKNKILIIFELIKKLFFIIKRDGPFIFLKRTSIQITQPSVTGELKNLSPRALKIYNDLNTAIKKRKKNK